MPRYLMTTLCFIWSCMFMSISYANVVMTGTRVIFAAENKDQSLQFSNKATTPYLVQLWLDQGNDQSTPETADAPFMVNPQLFRINPDQGQTVRLFYTGDGQLPKDRESIFYLNFKQIPAMNQATAEQNKLVLIVNSRLKVFYRPKNIVGKVEDLPRQLNYQLLHDAQGSWLQLNNPTGYYANITQATVKFDTHEIAANDVSMIAPKSSVKWRLGKNIPASAHTVLSVTLVNDYGAYTPHDLKPAANPK